MLKYRNIFLLVLLLWYSHNLFAIDFSCFQDKGIIKSPEGKTIKVITDSVNNYYFQSDTLLNTKILSNDKLKYFNFVVNGELTSNYSHTFDQYEVIKEITIHFQTTLKKNSFNYILSTNNYNYHTEISKDGKNWYKIEDDIRNYDLDYLKFTFNNKKLKNTTIDKLIFYKNGDNELLINSLSKNDIMVYNKYICDDKELSDLMKKTKKTQYFPIDIDTKTYRVKLENNPDFNPNHIINILNKDSDGDGVIDSQDNCINDYNPNQLDSTASWVWDICSDKDNDWIFWNIDNCPTLYNPEQTDENKNGIWDDCEIDTDTDGLFDSIDNCLYVANPDQYDIDEDSIGDTCDNCKNIYNPDQKNIDGDSIGDACDKKDNRYIESNKNFFIWILISVVILFLIWIFFMIRKIKNIQK